MNKALTDMTKDHYDKYPFIEGGANRIIWWKKYLLDFLPDSKVREKLIVDIGSGIGEISRGLIDRGARLACLDISFQSLQRCRQINPEAQIFHGNALALPFPDETFDHAISIGVLHHTPDCRHGFHEVSRVTAPGGTIVIFLYNYWSIYNLIYQIFRPIRAVLPLDRIPRWIVRILQPFVRIHLGQKLNDRELRNLLGDKLWTPQATFHSVSEVRKWGIEEGLKLVSTKKFFLAYANVMEFMKQGSQKESIKREVVLKCLECDKVPMMKNDTEFICINCGHVYKEDGGIFNCIKS